MSYKELFAEIANPNNKVFKLVLSMKGGVENVKYLVRNEKGKLLFYVLGSDFDEFAPDWVLKKIFVEGQETSFSVEQSIAVFTALSKRYSRENQKQDAFLQKNLKVM